MPDVWLGKKRKREERGKNKKEKKKKISPSVLSLLSPISISYWSSISAVSSGDFEGEEILPFFYQIRCQLEKESYLPPANKHGEDRNAKQTCPYFLSFFLSSLSHLFFLLYSFYLFWLQYYSPSLIREARWLSCMTKSHFSIQFTKNEKEKKKLLHHQSFMWWEQLHPYIHMWL